MVIVIKKSGKEEKFDIEKLKTSLASASDELKEPLSHSDIKMIAKEVYKQIEDLDKIESLKIYEILADILNKYKFKDLAINYKKAGNY